MGKMIFEWDYEIIDAHCHPFEKAENNLAVYGAPETLDGMTHELKKVGIDRACGSFIIRNNACSWEDIRYANDQVMSYAERSGGFYIPGIHVHGAYVEESCAELAAMHKRGVRWVGELVPYIMGTENLNSPGNMQILEVIRDLDMAVNLHWGSPEEIADVAEAFPTLKLILAHPGEIWESKERFEALDKYKNVCLDFSGTGLFRWNLLRWSIDRFGAERMLFGTDFPICSAGLNLYGALCENISHDEAELFFSGNFKRLTGL